MALATVLETWGSSPCPVGAQLLVCKDKTFYGSVSGGCVEGAVVLKALDVLSSGECQILEYDVLHSDAFVVGLACGGRIKILVEPVGYGQGVSVEFLRELGAAYLARKEIGIHVDLISWERCLIWPKINPEPFLSDTISLTQNSYYQIQKPQLRLIIIGAVHITQSLAPIAQMAGYHVTIIDPRESFANPIRFPNQELIVDWPEDALSLLEIDPGSALVTLTHDPKMDTPALRAAVASDAFYIGALGSRRTHAKRIEALASLGVDPEGISRINGPVGLDIGSRSPAEIAIAIMAELTQKLRKPQEW